jgi:ABC-type glycerol-3-phosphate transport system permease component
MRTTHRHGLSLSKLIIYLILAASILAVVYPMFWMISTSLKTDREIFSKPFTLPRVGGLQWINFRRAWTDAHFGGYFFNSVFVTVSTVVVTTLAAAMAAYALSRFRFLGAKPLLYYFIAGLIVPLQLAIVPLFFQMKAFHLLNSRLGLLLVYVAFGMPFAVFILTGFFKSLPSALYESALVDGAGEFTVFWSVMLPLAKPGLITVAIFSFIGTWNEFFLAFMFLSGEGSEGIRTLPLGIANVTIVSQYRSDWGAAFAALVLIMVPILTVYIILQKHITKGITVGALKG